MICPHCSTAVMLDYTYGNLFSRFGNPKDMVRLKYDICPNCQEFIINIQKGIDDDDFINGGFHIKSEEMIYPKRDNFYDENTIPKILLEDYEEALRVLTISPKSSAALSRRLLQSILRDKFDIKDRTLSQEIEKFIAIPGIPSHIVNAVDAIRQIGNLAAHPTKDKNTGEIVPVEIGEAEWLIEVLEALFDFAFIQPIKLEKRKTELNEKLEKAGKPKMK